MTIRENNKREHDLNKDYLSTTNEVVNFNKIFMQQLTRMIVQYHSHYY